MVWSGLASVLPSVQLSSTRRTISSLPSGIDRAGTEINGDGINALTANVPTFNVIGNPLHSTPFMVFNGSSSAGTANIVAGEVTDTNMGFNGGFIKFEIGSTAGQATITARADLTLNFTIRAPPGLRRSLPTTRIHFFQRDELRRSRHD